MADDTTQQRFAGYATFELARLQFELEQDEDDEPVATTLQEICAELERRSRLQ